MLDLQALIGLILGLSELDLEGQFLAFADTFAYQLLLWILNLGGLI